VNSFEQTDITSVKSDLQNT